MLSALTPSWWPVRPTAHLSRGLSTVLLAANLSVRCRCGSQWVAGGSRGVCVGTFRPRPADMGLGVRAQQYLTVCTLFSPSVVVSVGVQVITCRESSYNCLFKLHDQASFQCPSPSRQMLTGHKLPPRGDTNIDSPPCIHHAGTPFPSPIIRVQMHTEYSSNSINTYQMRKLPWSRTDDPISSSL